MQHRPAQPYNISLVSKLAKKGTTISPYKVSSSAAAAALRLLHRLSNQYVSKIIVGYRKQRKRKKARLFFFPMVVPAHMHLIHSSVDVCMCAVVVCGGGTSVTQMHAGFGFHP
jgi:hypothetical protein